MTDSSNSAGGGRVTVLGLGAMGHALAGALLDSGRSVTVWNRTAGRAETLVARGATEARTLADAIAAGGPMIVCLYDHASVRETLGPVADALRGHTIINLTTTTPAEARNLASAAQELGVAYLDGAIMATPTMIGAPGAQIFYSGSREVFDAHEDMFALWAVSTYDGADAGMASLFDLAMLAGMYPLFAAFLHGAAMVTSAGGTAAEFADRAAPFLAAMTASFDATASVVDSGDFSDPPQSLLWTRTALETIGRASREQGVDPAPVDMVSALVQHQIDAGHGADDFDRIITAMYPAPGEDLA